MNLRYFISISALILAAWLGFTFVNEVPTQPYPKLDKYAAKSPRTPAVQTAEIAAISPDSENFQVSASH